MDDLRTLWEREDKNDLIVDFRLPTIEIYNDYREG
jgi:hypothetical protein